jgi:hypothetical protein
MLAAIAAVFVAHAFYWYGGGPDFGARYWHLMLLPLVVLTARGIEQFAARTEPFRAGAVVVSLCALSLLVYMPWRALDKYHGYLRMRPDIRALAAAHGFGRSLVLVRGERFPDYESAAVYNPLDWNAAAPVYALDKSPEIRARLIQAFPDRPVWIVDGPTRTSNGRFRVVAGPLQAVGQALAPVQGRPNGQPHFPKP